jgi:hypothetical protein
MNPKKLKKTLKRKTAKKRAKRQTARRDNRLKKRELKQCCNELQDGMPYAVKLKPASLQHINSTKKPEVVKHAKLV